jgi:hypothetical protein
VCVCGPAAGQGRHTTNVSTKRCGAIHIVCSTWLPWDVVAALFRLLGRTMPKFSGSMSTQTCIPLHAAPNSRSVHSIYIWSEGASRSQLKKRGPFAELREGDAIESVEDSDERIMSDGGNPTAMQMTRLLGRSSISSAQSEKPTNPRNAFCPALAELLVNTRQMMGR